MQNPNTLKNKVVQLEKKVASLTATNKKLRAELKASLAGNPAPVKKKVTKKTKKKVAAK